jgi:hypothetical protein
VQELTLSYLHNIKTLDLSLNDNITTLKLSGISRLRSLHLPANLQSFTMSSCHALKEVKVPLNFNMALNLTIYDLYPQSIISLLENLADLSDSSPKTLTLGTKNLAKLTDEEKAIATNKNWNLA